MSDKVYVGDYSFYLEHNHLFFEPEIPPAIEKILRGLESSNILDYACGDSSRFIQFLDIFFKKGFLGSAYCYDSNRSWKKIWERTKNENSEINMFWTEEDPGFFEGGILHCSHGIYSRVVRDKIFRLFRESHNCHLMVIRGMGKASIFKVAAGLLGPKYVFNWEENLKKSIKKNGFRSERLEIPSIISLAKNEINIFAGILVRILGYRNDERRVKEAENIMKDFGHNGEEEMAVNNNDYIYFIYKPERVF